MPTRRQILTTVAAATGATAVGSAVRASGQLAGPPRLADDPVPATRNVLQWPFARESIWNMPIGSGAQYHDAGFQTHNPNDPAATGDQYIARNGYKIEHEIICLTPNAPLTDVWWNAGSFDQCLDRCLIMNDPSNGNQPRLLDRIPIPADWVFREGVNAGDVKINGCFVGIREPDSTGMVKELVGLFAFARCCKGEHAASRFVSSSTTGTWPISQRRTGSDIFGEGRFGEHGGTHLSVLGGALRLGELRPGGGRIRHALKIIVPRLIQWHPPDGVNNWVWPAFNGDRNDDRNRGTDPHVVQGALYALPPSLDINQMGFETEPGLQLAWTMQHYGAYNHDSTPAQTCALGVEVGPAGDFREQFRADWGFPMVREAYTNTNIALLRTDHIWGDGTKTGKWIRDLDRIFNNLHVITNNSPNSIGGGGTPRQPLAPPFG